MLNFDGRCGPEMFASVRYPELSVPRWWREAKFGIFIHWGLYSLPAWAEVSGEYESEIEQYAHHRYAEWIGNTARINSSPARDYLDRAYGTGTSYEDLADYWDADSFNPAELVEFFTSIGAQYLIPTAKHHDGFCLWNTETTPFNSVKRGPRLDLIEQFARAARAGGMKFGVYYSGALDWHVSDFPPITSNTELFEFRRNDEQFARYCAQQLRELIHGLRPDIIWNDIDWPDAGKSAADYGLAALFREYFQTVPDGVVNDRFGIPVNGFLTREYSAIDDIPNRPWEATRGLAHSFGYNRNERAADILSGTELIDYCAHTFAHGGNVLLNIGLRADGTIPPAYLQPLQELGKWMRQNL